MILSLDTIPGNFGDIVLGRFDNPQALAAGENYSQSRTFTLPTDLTGQFHVFVVTDEGQEVFENGLEANNIGEAAAIMDVMPIAFADLVVSNISVPATVGSGQTMTVLFTVTNQGIGLTSRQSWQDRLFLATDAAGTNRIAELQLDHIGPIAAGSNYVRGAQVVVPNGYSGDLFVVVQAAAQGGPFEFIHTDNNTSVSGAINVTLSPSPDLTVTNIIAPATALDGTAIDVTWTVTNQGAALASGTWEDLLFLQVDGDPDAAAVPLGGFTFTGPLAVGGSYTRTERIIVPSTTNGSYRVVVASNHDGRVFEDNTANNAVPDDAVIEVSLRPRADLQVQQVNAPADVDAGSTLALEFIVTNQGTLGSTPSRWKDIVYLSLDNQISNDDILIGEFDNGAALLPGDSYLTSTGSIVVPQRFRGDMFILVRTDNRNQVDEFPNENNLFAQPIFVNPLPLADLVVNDVIIPAQVTAGSTFDVTFSVENLGSGPTNIGQYLGQIWLTIDKNRPNPQAGDILLRTFAIDAPLDVNQGIDLTQSITLPANLPSGVYYITPWVDPVNAVLEDTLAINVNPDDPDEIDGNNFKAAAIDVVGVQPDLEVTQIIAPATAVGGDNIAVTYTVQNLSTGIANGKWIDRVYLTNMADPLHPDAHSIMVAERFHQGPLGVNESYTETVNVLLSPSASGMFFAVVTDDEQLAISDDFNVVKEVFEDNNSLAVATNVTPILADLVITNVEVSPDLQSGESVTIRYTVTNQGANALWTGSEYWQDFIWIGRGEEFDRIRASFLGTHVQAAPDSLAPGESYVAEFTAKLPQGLDGDYHIFIHLDAHNDLSPLFFPLTSRIVNEDWFPGDQGSNETLLNDFRRWAYEDPSNNLHSEAVTVEFFEPNLVLEEILIDTPPLSGELVQITYTVKNDGNRATRTDKYKDSFFLSRDASLDSADLFLSEISRQVALGAGDSYTTTLSFRLPEGVEGDFFILGFTDSFAEEEKLGSIKSDIGFNLNGVILSFDADFIPFDMVDLSRRDLSRGHVFEFQFEGDNILAEAVNITLSPAPDLQVTAIVAPSTVLSGQVFDVTFTVANLGTAAVPGSEAAWNNMLFLSRDGLLDIKSDKFLKESTHQGVLNPGESFDVTLKVQAPTDFLGEFNLFAVTDPIRANSVIGNVFEGTNERNNDRFVTILIEQPPATDMVIQEIRFDPSTVQTGELLHVEWDVLNTSGDTASGQWSDAVYLSLDETWDIGDRPMGTATFTGSVGAGESYSLSLDAFLPPVTPGPYFIIVRNDIFNQVFEGPEVSVGEMNNAAASTDTVEVTVQEIQLGIAFDTTLSRGQERLLAVQVPANETLRVTLRSSSGQSVHELFLRQDAAPTSATFDADYEGGLSANLISILPSTADGIVYILIRGQNEPGPNTPVTVIAELLPLSITNVKTDVGGDSAFVTATISGAKFDPGAVVTLTRPGFAEIAPVSFEVIDGTTIIAAFDFTGQPRGLYDVKVTNPDGAFAVVPYRFLVERAIEADVTIGVGGPRFILAGDVGTYSVAVQGTGNVDTPYVFFQVGIPEMGTNSHVYQLDYLNFFSNVRGSAPETDLDGVPFPSLNPATNTNGYLLTSGYLYDQHAFGFDGFTFNVETYPGLKELNERNFEQLRERIYAARPDVAASGVLDDGPQGLDLIQPGLFATYKAFGSIPDFLTEAFVPFQFNVVVAATAMTRAQFIEHSLGEAEQLRQGILADAGASAGLLAIAADKATWDALFLASLEEAGVLRPQGSAPPIREHAVIQSLMSLLATGALMGPAGSDLLSGDLIAFFESLRLQYGHDETLEAPTQGQHPTSGNPIPVLPTFEQFDLGLSAQTQFIAFNVYAPWIKFEDRGLGLPADFQFTGISFDDPSQLADLDLRRFLTGDAAATGIASITGPFSAESSGFLPVAVPLPYTVNFQNDPSASSFVNEVRIVVDIDEQLDTRSFRLGDIRIGDINIEVPSDRGVYTADIDFLDTKGFILRVSAGIDLAANEATWLLQAINPITGQLITDPNRGLLPPNNALGDGFGFVSYTIRTEDDVNTGDEVTASARVFFDNAAPEDTELLTQRIDAAAPVTQLTVTRITPAAPNFNVSWNALDDTDGSGFKHVTIYVAEDGGDFVIWQRRRTDASGSEVFTGTQGKSYEFLALATDKAGNREEPPLGLLAPNDGSGVNLGELTDLEGTLPDFGIAPTPSAAPSTNALFTAAELGDLAAVPPVLPPEFDGVLRPFTGRTFATNIAQSHADIAAMAIVEAPDGSFLISGGAGRNELYRFTEDGGIAGTPLATLAFPIFNLAFDSQGRLWATTGGGPLLELDPTSGAILNQFGEGLTIALAVEPGTDRVFVSSNGGVEVFDPATQTFTRFSRDKDLRVGSLAFSPTGELFAVTWPDRQSVVKFNERRRVETVLTFDSLIDSISFGQAGTSLEGLLFVSHNTGALSSTGAVEPNTSELTMVDMATLRTVAVAQGGSRGDVVRTTSDGRILISQSTQVDVLKPAEHPLVVSVDPANGSVVDVSLTTITIEFSEDMFIGTGSEADSVLNINSYVINGNATGAVNIEAVDYDVNTRTVTLTIAGLAADQFTLTISDALTSIDHLSLAQPVVTTFSVATVNIAPQTRPDQASTIEDVPVVIDVLLNDADANGDINPTTVVITQQPLHGSASANATTGRITYTPVANYSGPDELRYTVKDLAGQVSNESLVKITVAAVADVPLLTAEAASGPQDTAIALAITAALTDTDGSESLLIEISGVPDGATLSAGTLIAPGVYSLTADELVGLTLTPALGSSEDFTLFITATATEGSNGAAASETVVLPVEVVAAVVDPVTVTDFVINDGDAQRSFIHSATVQFNQDVIIEDVTQNVRLIARGTGAAVGLTPDRFTYDDATFTLRINLDGITLPNDHYFIRLSTDGITSAAARNVHLTDTDLRPDDGALNLEFHKLEADWDGNDLVNQSDGSLLGMHYVSKVGQPKYDADFDVNSDGIINQTDYTVWRRALNRSSDSYGPELLIALANDTGRSDSDRVTFDATIKGAVDDTAGLGVISAGVDAAATFNISSFIAPDGTFTLTLANLATIKGSALLDGVHTLNILARDARGNTSTSSLTFTLDRLAPAAPAQPDLLPAFDSGASSTDNLTNLSALTVRTSGAADDLVRLTVDGNATGAQLGAGPHDFAINLAEGVHDITAQSEDLAGNLSVLSPILSITVDKTPPTLPVFDTTSTVSDTITLTGQTDANTRVDLIEAGLTATSAGDGSYSFAGIALALGLNKFTVTATDAAGNSSTFAGAIRRLGAEQDAPVIVAGLANDTGISASDGITTDATITGSVIDPSNTPIAMLMAGLGGTPNVDITSALAGGFFTVTPALLELIHGGALADGAYTLSLQAKDAFLNLSTVTTVSFTLDRTVPAIPGTPELAAESDLGDSDDNLTSDDTPTFEVSGEDDAIIELIVDGLSVSSATVIDGIATLTAGPLGDGDHEVTARTVSDSGAASDATPPLIITIDTVGPAVLTLFLDPLSDTAPAGDDSTALETVALIGMTDSNTRVQLFRGNALSVAIAETVSNGAGEYSFADISLAIGANAFTAAASDAAGNTLTASRTITSTAADTLAPVVLGKLKNDTGRSASDAITFDATITGVINDASAITAFTASIDGKAPISMLSKLVGGVFTLSITDLNTLNGSALPDGTHTLTLRATDQGGLQSAAHNVIFTLDTLRPNRPETPDLLAISDTGLSDTDNITNAAIISLVAGGENGAILRLFIEGALTDQLTLTGTQTTFDLAGLSEGIKRISTRAEDVAGNQSLFSNLLLVTIDRTAPDVVALALDDASNTRPFGDNETTFENVRLVGSTEAGMLVTLQNTGAEQLVGADGAFAFKRIDLPALGDHLFTVSATDTAGNTTVGQQIIKRVDFTDSDLLRPEVTLTVSSATNTVGGSVTLTLTTADNIGVVSRELVINGQNVTVQPDGTATFTPTTPGFFTATATAKDAAGNEGQAQGEFSFFLDPVLSGDTTAPIALINDADLTGIVNNIANLTGTASDANLLRYTLAVSPKGVDAFEVFATGTSNVTDGVLGAFDPTVLNNGFYDVRLTVIDTSGNSSTSTRTLRVEGQTKVGNFTVAFIDASIPAAGLPLNLTRAYDSRNRFESGDFGFGWDMSVDSLSVSAANVLGNAGFTQTVSQLTADFKFVGFSNSKDVTVAVTMPDGQVEKFILGFTGFATTAANPGPLQRTKLFFKPLPGTTTTLEALADNIVDVVPTAFGPVEFHDRTTGEVYNPTRFKLTMSNGSFFIINTETGIESVTDTNGNALTFTPDAITHTDGRGIVIVRDLQDRITSITDPAGATTTYGYDFYGDLVTVTDTLGNVTRFTYDNNHRLLEVFDPLGRMGQRNEYDDDGRIIASIDGAGHRIEYEHDLAAKQEVVEDRKGAKTVTNYNENGFVTSITDALGNVTRFGVDDVGNVLSITDALGNITLMSYDDQNRMLTRTDPLGNTTSWTYDARGNVTSVTDPKGNSYGYEYDSRGNLTKLTDALANETDYIYNAAGLLTQMTDALGGVTTLAYDSQGNVVSETNALGHETTYTYNARGQQLSRTVTRTDEFGIERPLTVSMVYDALGRTTQLIDPFGEVATVEYNAAGQMIAREGINGERGEYSYDARGMLTRADYSDGTFDDRTYDANGAMTSFTSKFGTSALYEYDALGRNVRSVNDRGQVSVSEFDALGRGIAKENAFGDRVEFEYDAGGRFSSSPSAAAGLSGQPRVTASTDSSGRRIEYAYDPNGNVSQLVTAEGDIITPVYDALNRQTSMILPDGVASHQAYDALGRITSVESGDGLELTNGFDAIGRLSSVTNLAGQTIAYDYDELGNRTSITDANNNTTQWTYDDAGRITSRTLPMGMTESWTYNELHFVTSYTDFNGDTTTFAYDADDLLITETYDDGSTVTYTYTDAKLLETVTDSRGVTSYFYNDANQLNRYVNPDGTEVTYGYGLGGRLESITSLAGTTSYTYDNVGVLDSVTDASGGVTTWTDGVRTSTQHLPNGATQTTTIDVHGRITTMLIRDAGGDAVQSFIYDYNDADRSRTITELGGRATTYRYDENGWLIEETVADPVNGNETTTYTYDAFGNRATKNDSAGTITYTYDANDRLMSETGPSLLITYIYDDNGNLTSRTENGQVTTYAYDFEDRLIRVDTATGDVIEYAYDHEGRRVSRTLNGVVTNYLLNIMPSNEQVLDEYDASGNVIASYTYGLGRISQDRGGDVSYYHTDAQTSVRVLTDAAGELSDAYAYDAFGNLLDTDGSTVNPFGYVSEMYDPMAGLVHLRARDLDPRTGRFMQLDPAAGIPLLPVSLNKYIYGNSDPTSYADPSGELAGIMEGLRLVNTIIQLTGLSITAAGLGVVTFATLNAIRQGATWTGFGFAASTGASLGQIGQISVSQDRGLIIDLANMTGEIQTSLGTFFAGQKQNLNQAVSVTEGYSIGGSVNYSPVTRAVAALGMLYGEAGVTAGVSIDFNHANDGDSATASIGAYDLSVGFAISLGTPAGDPTSFSLSISVPDVVGTFFKELPLMGSGSIQPNFTELLGDLKIGSTGDFSLGAGFSHATYNPLVLAFMNTVFPPGIPAEFIDDYWVMGMGWWNQYQKLHGT
ncbi:MAG: Ig-like domain-containing protein [Phycisphaeraceae bacterium]